jgi:voltage-gated potassium channel Kch
LASGERLVIVEAAENASVARYFRSRGADVYIGDARLLRVLADVGVRRAKALYSLIDNDFAGLQVGLNARCSHRTSGSSCACSTRRCLGSSRSSSTSI